MRAKNIIITPIILLFIIIPIIAGIYGDLFWFSSMGYESVFLKIFFTSIWMGAIAALTFFAISNISIKLAKRVMMSKAERKKSHSRDFAFYAVTGIVSLIIGSIFSNWSVFLKYANSTAFGNSDPVFGANIGFYAFDLPFLTMIYSFFFVTVIATSILTFISYLVYLKSKPPKEGEETEGEETEGEPLENMVMSFRYSMDWPALKKKMISHMSVMLGLFFFLLAIGFVFAQYGILFSGGTVYGAGYTDLNVNLLVIQVLSLLSFVVGVLFMINLKIRKWKFPIETLKIFAGVFVIGLVASGIVQGFIVEPNEFNLEKPYIERNIEYTRKAYGLNSINEEMFDVKYNLTSEDIENSEGIINNIRLWDWRPLRQTYDQLQLFRTYYDFNDVDIDRYDVNGKYTQVMVSAREMNINDLPSNARTWVNEHLVYTHGYGIVMNPVEKVSEEGLPEFYIKDIPPQSDFFDLENPRIYFGEMTNNFVITGTTTDELDYPSGEENIYRTYDGTGGLELSSINRLIYALKFGSIELLVSGSIKPESKLLMYRNIHERIKKIAPFLSYEPDPYIVLSNGQLYWIIDAYTTTDMYPYSEPVYQYGLRRSFNYIRNSVKVVVDVYNGDVNYFVIDNNDPVIQTYRKIFPELFKDFSEMSADLQKHIRYPESLFSIQAELYSTYHMNDPRVFYNKEDIWVIPDEIYHRSRTEMTPYYMILEFPDSDKEEFIMMIPFTPREKENMIGWMAAKSDAPNYGQLIVYQFSKQELIFGPMQIEARIDQDTEISQRFTLWDQGGSAVIRGNTLVIPIKDSIMYVVPVYLEATEKGTLPQLKRVIVVYENKVSMQLTLEDALNDIFGGIKPTTPTPGPTPGETPDEVLAQVKDLYDKAQDALTSGNLALYAQYIEQMGELLEEFV